MSPSRLRDRLALALLAALFIASVYRAATLSIAMDEAYTYLSFVAPPLRQILTTYSPNHHVLFSLLAKASVQIFGASELSLRLPALLGALIFMAATWRIARTLFADRPTMLLAVCLITLNPMTFDYMSQARGYSLALGFYMFGLLFAIESGPVLAGVMLGLSMAANIAFGVPVLALNVLLAFTQRKSLLRLIAIEVIVLAAIAGSPLLHADPHSFVGFNSIRETLDNFSIASVLHDWDGNGLWTKQVNVWTSSFFYPAFRAVVLIMLAICAIPLWQRLRARTANNDWLFYLSGSLILSVVILIAEHITTHAPYPYARVVIYCWPLLAFMMCLLIERDKTKILLAFCLLMVIQFALQFDTDHFAWLEYSAGTRQIVQRIPDREVTISTSGSLYACLDFYRSIYSMKRWHLQEKSTPPQSSDYLVSDTFEARTALPANYKQLWRDPLSGAILAAPRAR